MIKRVLVGSGPVVGICEGASTEMMDIEGMTVRLLSLVGVGLFLGLGLILLSLDYIMHPLHRCPSARHCGSLGCVACRIFRWSLCSTFTVENKVRCLDAVTYIFSLERFQKT